MSQTNKNGDLNITNSQVALCSFTFPVSFYSTIYFIYRFIFNATSMNININLTCWNGIFDCRLFACWLSICSDNRFATSLTSSANFDSTLIPASTLPLPTPLIPTELRSAVVTSFLPVATRPTPPTWVSSSNAPVSPLRAPLSLPSASLNSLKPLSNCFQAISEVVRPSRRLVILKVFENSRGFLLRWISYILIIEMCQIYVRTNEPS